MKRLYIISFVILCLLPFSCFAQTPAALVERDFFAMVNAWSTKDYNRLWMYGTNTSKSVITPEEFALRMTRSSVTLIDTPDRARDVRINMVYPTLAYVRASMTFIDRVGNKVPVQRQFQLVYEDGFFRVGLLGLY